MNYARINQAFQRHPMCHGALAEAIGEGERYAVCAVGALIIDTGAATPSQLENMETNEAIKKYFPELRKTYGFRSHQQVRGFVYVNDQTNRFIKKKSVFGFHQAAHQRTLTSRIRKALSEYLHTLRNDSAKKTAP